MSTSLTFLSDIKNEFIIRQNSATTAAYYTDSVLGGWADQSQKMAAAYKKWPMTSAKYSTSYASLAVDDDGKTYGNYPEGWKLQSIRQLKIGGMLYDKRDFYYGFHKFLEDFSSADDKIFTDYNNLFYINAGSGNSGTVVVWGQYVPNLDLTDPNSITIFSYSDEDGNQAIVEFMQGFAMTREKKEQEAALHFAKGYSILDRLWVRFGDEKFNYKTSDNDGMFKRIDVVGGAFREDEFKRDQFI